MRFYTNKQAEMVLRVNYLLGQEKEKLAKKVPILNTFIAEFREKANELQALKSKNPGQVKMKTLEKTGVKQEFMKVIATLIGVLKAAGYRAKGKPIKEMSYCASDLRKLSADNLCKAYINVYTPVKKIRNLELYGLSDGDLREMQAYYNEFRSVKKAPALKKKEVARQHERLTHMVKECITYLENHIDSLMPIATGDDWKLMDRYKSDRKVLPRGFGRPSDDEVKYRKSRAKKKATVDKTNTISA